MPTAPGWIARITATGLDDAPLPHHAGSRKALASPPAPLVVETGVLRRNAVPRGRAA
ncbi:hypothetical protein [Streptomyces sp. NPDC053427]|uniref:hypothetical protein n=1 Tax=Streptomyces sp. NPDC053427 TaxID=3365701 RepID=UPI0037D8C89B